MGPEHVEETQEEAGGQEGTGYPRAETSEENFQEKRPRPKDQYAKACQCYDEGTGGGHKVNYEWKKANWEDNQESKGERKYRGQCYEDGVQGTAM